MNQTLIKISLRRGRLIERIANQRATLARDMQPVRSVLHTTDQAVLRIRSFTGFIKKHPDIVLGAVALLAVLKPSRTWHWAKRSFIAWRAWQALREQLARIKLRTSP